MPRVPDGWVDAVAYLYPTEEAAKAGQGTGGSGVLVGVRFREYDYLFHVYVVTNAHVAATCRVVRVNSRLGPAVWDLTDRRWFPHQDGDDLVVAMMGFNAYFDDRVAFHSSDMGLVTREFGEEVDLGYGDELFMTSRFLGHEGRQENEPIIRFGTLAKSRPVLVANQHTGIDQESYLVEMRWLPGHSGSPAYVYFSGRQVRLGVERKVKAQIRLLGIDWGHMNHRARVLGPDGRPLDDGSYVEQNAGIACVVPAWKILEVLEQEEVAALRDKVERKAEDVIHPDIGAAPSLDIGDGSSTLGLAGDLMSKLIQVPKGEADEVHR